MKRRLWVVSELYYPDAQATSRILTTLAEGLASDFDVRVLCAYPTMQFAPVVDVPQSEVRNGVSIRRFRSARLNKAVLLFRTFNLMTISLPVYLHLLFNLRRGDSILVVTNPPVMPFVALSAARVRGARTVVLTHDVYPDVLIPAGILSRDDILYKLLARAARWLYSRASGAVVLGRDMERRVRNYIGGGDVPTRIIPNWGEPDRITVLPRSENRFLTQHRIIRKFVALHAGTMGRTHGIEDLLACVSACSSVPDLHFVFAGVGVKRVLVERQLLNGRANNITLLPFVDAQDQNELLNACDVAIISMMAGMEGISVPSRMYNTMAAGKPIIAVTDPESELALVVEEQRIGWVVRPGDTEGLRTALLEAKDNSQLLIDMGRRARAVAESTYLADTSVRKFREFLSTVSA